VQQQRVDFWQTVTQVPSEWLIFIDEMGVHTGMQRTQARSRCGQRAYSPQFVYRGQKTTVIGAMSQSRWLAKRTLVGSMKTDDFYTFIEDDLLPLLKPHHVLVLDNLPVHKHPKILELLKAAEVTFLFLPPYSPDLNPIEMLWAKVKSMLRFFIPRSSLEIPALLGIIHSLIPTSFFNNWVTKCCYCSS